MKPINVGLLGIGTVVAAPYRAANATRKRSRVAPDARSASRGGGPQCGTREKSTGGACRVTDDAFSVVNDPEVDIVIELIGGYGVAKELVLKAIANASMWSLRTRRCWPRTATRFSGRAEDARDGRVRGGGRGRHPHHQGGARRFDREPHRVDRGHHQRTTNFILSEMRDKGLSFDTVLKEAQRLGYAEADPTFDIEGVDAAHKITILSALAFGIPMQFDKAYIEGISKLDAVDIK